MRVAVAGAGLGGLCLAQGLLRAGVDVQVYERDATPDERRQGYRLHMDARGGDSLAKCLPPPLYELFLATTGQPGSTVTALSARRLRVLRETKGDGTRLSTSADRGTLREILATGLADRIHYGRGVTGFSPDPDGVTVGFVDGSSTRADVLVGADGVSSAVRRTLLPDAQVVETGDRVIYGKTPPIQLLPAMHQGFTAIVARRLGLATGLVQFRQSPHNAADYLMWALSGRRFQDADPATLHAAACRAIRFWHPSVRALLERATVSETFFIRVRVSRPVPAWPPSRVTLLGDAIHAMSPSRGSGANLALLDAAHLCDALTGGGDLIAAIGAYEERMRGYGFTG
jgi:2-polyprenyl-6-methoxyphenol hydroxylase-like FAD-dependent oxidoreductase